MFGIGVSEIILIFLVIVILIRPNDLPKFLRSAGRFYGKAKKMYNEIMLTKDKIIKEIDTATTLDDVPVITTKVNETSAIEQTEKKENTKPQENC